MKIQLQARVIKTSVVLDPAALAGVEVPSGTARALLLIDVAGRTVRAEVSGKGLRKVAGMIRETGADRVAVVLSGKLEAGDIIAEASVVCQPRAPKQPAGGGQ
jgi:hypothetical protein